MTTENNTVKARNTPFAEKASTRIWEEVPSASNPYIAEQVRCHGYDLLELVEKRSFVEVFFLLFRGELPRNNEARLLEALMVGLINPGPRHPATRAAITAGIGKTFPEHMLPIALTVLGGKHLGAGMVEDAMRFLRANLGKRPEEVAATLLTTSIETTQGDVTLAPGFGTQFGGIDIATGGMAQKLVSLAGAGSALAWGGEFAAAIAPARCGWLPPGLAAAAFCDLGFQPRAGAGLYQLLAAPGLLAHGLEYSNKPVTALPRISDQDYVIEA